MFIEKNSNILQERFPYLNNFKIDYSKLPNYVTRVYNTESYVEIKNPQSIEFLDFDTVDNSQVEVYPYDMTAYINNETLRYKDSIVVANFFDHEWQQWVKGQKPDSNYPDVPFQDAFHGARRCFQFLKTPSEIMSYYFKISQIQQPNSIPNILKTSLQIVIPFFSHMKATIHNKIQELPPISYLYTELDTIAGYPIDEHRALTDDSIAWLTDDVPDSHSPSWWASQITNVLLSSGKQNSEMLLTFSEFLTRPWLWLTSGASSQSQLVLGTKKVKTKFGAAVSLTPQQLLGSVLHAVNPKSTNIDIFIKPDERGFKRRLIANMDLGSYLIASYIRYLIEWLDGPIPEWMTATTSPNLDLNVIQFLREKQTAIPLDESAFDHHLSRNAWLGFLASLDYLFPDNFGVHLFHALFANSWFFDRATFKKSYWFKGMPSGLAITALGNTLFNYVKQRAIISPLHFGLGDDVLVFSNRYTLDKLSNYYKTFGAEVNQKKNWLSTQYAEYLHFLYCRHGRVGLPARMYGSLIFGLKFTDISPLQRLNELTTMFKDFFDRAALIMPERVVAADLSRSVSARWTGFSTETALTWMHIPKALSGFGMLPYVFKQFQVKNVAVTVETYSNSLIPLPPVRTVTKSTFQVLPFQYKNTSYRLGPSYHLEPITTWDEWAERLQGKYPGLTPFQAQYALDVIPLPEIPFISSSRMSSFASQLKYNAYPNLRGSKVAVTSRFISASLALAGEVALWQRAHHIAIYV